MAGNKASSMNEASQSVPLRLNGLLTEAGLEAVDSVLAGGFEAYLSLLLRWNARVNLTAVRDEGGILSRHFVESIACARALPAGIATLLDFGRARRLPFCTRLFAPSESRPESIPPVESRCWSNSIASPFAPLIACPKRLKPHPAWLLPEAGSRS
jgi:hypothetical protein